MVLYPNKLPESERVCSGICTLAIVGHVVYALLSESEPPRLVSQGKSYTVKELNNEGYNPEICFSGDFSLSL